MFHDDSVRIGRKPAANIQTKLLLTFNEGQDAEIHAAPEDAGSHFENTEGSGGAPDPSWTIGWRPPLRRTRCHSLQLSKRIQRGERDQLKAHEMSLAQGQFFEHLVRGRGVRDV